MLRDAPTGYAESSDRKWMLARRLTREIDTVMSRMYNQNGNLYSGVFDCLYKTVKTEGPLAVYKVCLKHEMWRQGEVF